MFTKNHISALLVRCILFVALIMGLVGLRPAQVVLAASNYWYVNQNAQGDNDGTSWANAYTDLQSALSSASTSSDDDIIWVAAGTYKPTDTNERTTSFVLPSGVEIYGGFNGTETEINQRDPTTNISILSGDIGIQADTSDNSFHVIEVVDVENPVVLDGFTVTGGNANDEEPYNRGGGIYHNVGTLSVVNTILSFNHSVILPDVAGNGEGGAIYSTLGTLTISTSTFDSNTASRGGAIVCDGGMLTVTDSSFYSNSATSDSNGDGGAIYSNCNATFVNDTFSSNMADHYGGAILTDSDIDDVGITNSTFYGNSSLVGGGVANYGRLTVTNSTFSDNSSPGGGAIKNGLGGTLSLRNSILANSLGSVDCSRSDSTPAIENINNLIETTGTDLESCGVSLLTVDPILDLLADNGGATKTMALLFESPAIGAGDNATCAATDQRGVTRPQGSHCDIGAYEEDILPDLIIESITVTPANPATNQAVTLSIVVKNQGPADSGEFYLDLFIDAALPSGCGGVGQRYAEVTYLAAGVSQTINLNYDGFASAGVHTINGIVDTDCEVSESDESNNTKVITVEVANILGAGPGTYDGNDSRFGYVGNWAFLNMSGPYMNTLNYSSSIGDSATFMINGSSFVLYYTQHPNRGNTEVYVDNAPMPVATINMSGAALAWQKTWSSGNLGPGDHTLKFVHASGTIMDIDAIQVIPVPGAGTYDGNDSRFGYVGNWAMLAMSGPYASTLNYSSSIGDTATFMINGSSFVLYYTQHPNRGNTEVYVDNGLVPVATINMSGAALAWQKTWSSGNLGAGEHTLKFVHASGTIMDIDAIQVNGPDVTAPAAISLNAQTGSLNGSVLLNWTAVGDDGTSGSATSYLVRYSTSPITSGNWDAATPVSVGVPTPKPAGQSESMLVTGLTAGSTYYFAVRAQDEVPNLGNVSNSPSAVAANIPPPGPGTYDGNDSRFVRVGNWAMLAMSGPYASTLNYSSSIGDTATFMINGSSFVLYYTQHPNRGNTEVYVDNGLVPVATINMSGAALAWQKTWSSGNLGAGEHTLKFVHASGTIMDIDAIQVNGPDVTAPAAISLNAQTGSLNGSVLLNWTAVGDDGTSGSATSYLVRYSTSPITSGNWDAATPVSVGVPTPKPAGQSESMLVTGLTAGSTYYFAVRAQDEVPNLGNVSNSPSAVAADIPPPGPGTYDGNDSRFVRVGNWAMLAMSGPYMNTLNYSSSIGDTATFMINGSSFVLYYTQHPNRGNTEVYVDNGLVPVATINMSGAALAWQKTWSSGNLGAGEHTLKFVHASGTIMDIDAIQVNGPDVTAPAAISLNAQTGSLNGSVLLNWTAVGDDGTSGSATSYLVRYSTSPITSGNWDAATPVSVGVPTPKPAGQSESMLVTGLTAGSTYYFAVRAQDEVPNLGNVSNSPSAVAANIPPPGPGTYDGNDSRFVRVGNWAMLAMSGPYASTLNYSSSIGDTATFMINGSSFVLYYTQHPNRGNTEVYVDNGLVPVATINMNGAALAWQKTWSSGNLGAGEHTLKFVHASGTILDIDAIQVNGLDVTAPAAISLNAQTGSLNGSVLLNWTAVGDDGTSGSATSYLVRYSTSPITSGNWDAATPVTSGVPTPKVAGQAESLLVTGLTAGSTYYFAVRAQDEVPNLGNVSNSPSAVAADILAAGAGTYDGNDSWFGYEGNWAFLNMSGPYMNTLNYSSSIGDTATFTMNGPSFVLYYTQNTNRGDIKVYVDNVLRGMIDANGALVWQKTWSSPNLGAGVHTLKFVHASGTTMDIDAILIAP